jgi:hypothetical protein
VAAVLSHQLLELEGSGGGDEREDATGHSGSHGAEQHGSYSYSYGAEEGEGEREGRAPHMLAYSDARCRERFILGADDLSHVPAMRSRAALLASGVPAECVPPHSAESPLVEGACLASLLG